MCGRSRSGPYASSLPTLRWAGLRRGADRRRPDGPAATPPVEVVPMSRCVPGSSSPCPRHGRDWVRPETPAGPHATGGRWRPPRGPGRQGGQRNDGRRNRAHPLRGLESGCNVPSLIRHYKPTAGLIRRRPTVYFIHQRDTKRAIAYLVSAPGRGSRASRARPTRNGLTSAILFSRRRGPSPGSTGRRPRGRWRASLGGRARRGSARRRGRA